jgi:hypothetical protein
LFFNCPPPRSAAPDSGAVPALILIFPTRYSLPATRFTKNLEIVVDQTAETLILLFAPGECREVLEKSLKFNLTGPMAGVYNTLLSKLVKSLEH